MTTVTVTTEVPPRRKTEDNAALCVSSSAHILEETEYVRKIRTTLEKIRNHMFKDEAGQGNASCKRDTEQSGNLQNGSQSTTDPTSLDLLMENMRRKDQQLLEMNRENEVLKIKLEASREAGAAALRNVAQRLFDNYQTHSEDMKKRHEDSKRLLQINNLEKEQMLKQRVENLSQLSEKLEEKHGQIVGLENRVQRMENLPGSSSRDFHPPGADLSPAVRDSLSAPEPAQHHPGGQGNKGLSQMEGLKSTLKEQDEKIENLKEKVNILETQNKELKTKVANWTETPKAPVSKAVSTSELKPEGASPYLMLVRLRK
ncbi:coiled-coil domain-containing protein 68 isoform X2 [Arvicola amphibius]|uniref:coiled-coil domain-containing protein 68 isoform X2 n=1 Tax=Arvicola amphibius TaxID=1047088 RepID=UPI0018E30E31|nr:coiled-coil domain-containing protein 68 isoform X2 [Arvicola amphibius]